MAWASSPGQVGHAGEPARDGASGLQALADGNKVAGTAPAQGQATQGTLQIRGFSEQGPGVFAQGAVVSKGRATASWRRAMASRIGQGRGKALGQLARADAGDGADP